MNDAGTASVTPPGTSKSPRMAARMSTQWPACTPLEFVSMARPHMNDEGWLVATARAAAAMVSAGTHVISSTLSSGYCAARSLSSSKP